jgi:hypothetical protein
VTLPKLCRGRDRTFFIFSWESLRTAGAATQRGVVPLPAMLKGDLAKATDAFGKPIQITDPLAKAPFPNNQIPSSRLDPVAQNIGA